MEESTRVYPQTELAYLAGLLDGEGYFRWRTGSPAVHVHMKDRGAIDWLFVTFGGIITKAEKTSTGNQMWNWRFAPSHGLREVLPSVLPYMRVRRDAAINLLEAVHV